MKKVLITSLVVAMVLTLGITFADKPQNDGENYNGNGFPSGPHEELGLIGRPNTYSGNGTNNSKRANIFIPLDTEGYVDGKVKLKMTQGDGFLVIDGDATDDGVAEFQIAPGNYAVFARALGKPTGRIRFWAWFTYWIEGQGASDAIYLGGVDLTREKGKPQTVEISKLFYYTGDILDQYGSVLASYVNEWVFDVLNFFEYWWDIDNDGCKRLEIRFYEVPDGYQPPEIPPEYSEPEP